MLVKRWRCVRRVWAKVRVEEGVRRWMGCSTKSWALRRHSLIVVVGLLVELLRKNVQTE